MRYFYQVVSAPSFVITTMDKNYIDVEEMDSASERSITVPIELSPANLVDNVRHTTSLCTY